MNEPDNRTLPYSRLVSFRRAVDNEHESKYTKSAETLRDALVRIELLGKGIVSATMDNDLNRVDPKYDAFMNAIQLAAAHATIIYHHDCDGDGCSCKE